MEMKLSGTRIKALRHKLSWSQEKLAEEAGLNPRTVQRAETDGSASLRTRLQLAEALQVLPEELDAENDVAESAPGHEPAAGNIYFLTVLLVVSVIYLAAQPAYFSLSITKFNAFAYGLGTPLPWATMALSLWTLFYAPMLGYVRKKHGALFIPYLGAAFATLGLAVLRLAQPGWVAESLTTLVSLGGLALLAALYFPKLGLTRIRHALVMLLGAYAFIWCIHDLGIFAVSAFVGAWYFGHDLSVTTPLWYVGGTLLRNLTDLIPLIPAGLVLALSFGERPALRWPLLTRQAMPEPPVTP